MAHQDMTTEEEVRMSTPYSDVATWRRGDVATNSGGAITLGRVTFLRASGHVGKDGRPLVFYHGTRDDIGAFDTDHANRKDLGWLGRGIYTASDADDARYYASAKRGAGAPRIMPLYVAVRNTYVATVETKERLKNASQGTIDQFTQDLLAKGHDGVVMAFSNGHVELMAFEPTQVKSAIGNVGAYGQRAITAQEAENAGMTEAQASQAQAEGDIRFSRSAMKSVDANVRRGTQALTKALNEKTTVRRAMFRNGLGGFCVGRCEEGDGPHHRAPANL